MVITILKLVLYDKYIDSGYKCYYLSLGRGNKEQNDA